MRIGHGQHGLTHGAVAADRDDRLCLVGELGDDLGLACAVALCVAGYDLPALLLVGGISAATYALEWGLVDPGAVGGGASLAIKTILIAGGLGGLAMLLGRQDQRAFFAWMRKKMSPGGR